MRLALLALTLLTSLACATRGPIISEDEPCSSDAECAATNFVWCCSCPAEPRAVNRQELARSEKVCAVVECKCVVDCGKCPRVQNAVAWDAVCIQGHCAAVLRR